MSGPYKMKGSPMARNYGAPFKQDGDKSFANIQSTRFFLGYWYQEWRGPNER